MRLAILTLVPVLLQGGAGQNLLQAIAGAGLDRTQCYRVRDISFGRDEAQIYLNDGFLIFGAAVNGIRVNAVFSADVEGGDAELLLLPPDKGERRLLAAHTDSPNLEEHFNGALMVFTADIYRELMAQIEANPYNKRSGEMGALLAEKWKGAGPSVNEAFSVRAAVDLLSPDEGKKGFFAAALNGRKLGFFNLIFDPRASEQMVIGKPDDRGFDVWSSFVSRSYRGKPFSPEFSIRSYRIDARLGKDLGLRCATAMEIDLTTSHEGALPFEISRQMRVLSASVDGREVEVLGSRADEPLSPVSSSGNYSFILALGGALAPGIHRVEIQHEGRVIADAGNRVYFVGSRGSWYPGRGVQFSRYDLTFHYPPDLDLVATGTPVEERSGTSEKITHTSTAGPVRVAGFNLGVYERASVKRGDLVIEVCANRTVEKALEVHPQAVVVPIPQPPRAGRRPSPGLGPIPDPPPPPPNPLSRLQALASEMGDVMEFFAAKFGAVPLKRLEVSPVPGRFGQGFAGMIYLSTLSYLNERSIANVTAQHRIFFTDLLHAHEAAHQWWGNVVTSAGYHDEWIMEALANYSALLYLEKRKGTRVADLVLEDYRQELLQKTANGGTVESEGPVIEGQRLDQAWAAIVYGKGTWIIHMLRKRLGEGKFAQMLADLRRAYEDKPLTTDQFRAHCAKYLPPNFSDRKLEAFFDQWVYGTGIPELKLKWELRGKAPNLRVAGTVTQKSVDENFVTETPIEIDTVRGRSRTEIVRAVSSDPVSFDVKVPAAPAKVAIDGRAILHR